MPRMLPVLLGGDANVYGMARSFYECYGVRSLAVCRRALLALAHSRLVRVAVQDPAFGQDHVFTATLLGPSDEKITISPPSYPYIVVKTEYRKEPVIFERFTEKSENDAI